MSISKAGANNPLYGKTHTKSTKILMSLAKKGKTLSANTKSLISNSLGKKVYLYELVFENSFSLIKSFNSGSFCVPV